MALMENPSLIILSKIAPLWPLRKASGLIMVKVRLLIGSVFSAAKLQLSFHTFESS